MNGGGTVEIGLLVLAGAANIVGALAVTARTRWSARALEALIAVSAGFMLAVALLDVIPESIAQSGPDSAVMVLLGYVLVHFTQHTLTEHFHFGEETHQVSRHVGHMALVGLLLHTFVDGVAIASSFHVDERLGLLVFLAILLHKFPEGLAVSSLFLAAGMGRVRALQAATTLGLVTVAGGVVTPLVGALRDHGLPLAGGVALYVAASNLVPEFQAKRGWRLPMYFFAGCLLYFGASTLAGMLQ